MLKRYGLLGAWRLIWSLIFTKLAYPQARLIRLPFDIRNKRLIEIGKNFTTGFGCRIEALPEDPDYKEICIQIGSDVQINDYVHIAATKKVVLGNNVLIASKVYISDINHGSYGKDGIHDNPDIPPTQRRLSSSPVFIEDNVWIGEFVSILAGVTVGKGSIIGANSVVTKTIPPYSIAIGNPAKIIKRFNFKINEWERL